MSTSDSRADAFMHLALVLLESNSHLRKGGTRLNREMLTLPDAAFKRTVESLQRAHDFGLTRIREILRSPSGEVTEIVFEQVLTPAGRLMVRNPVPRVTLSPDVRQFLRERLERQLATGESGGSPMINGLGEPAGDLSDYLSPDQIRANARQQLDLMDEEDRRSADHD